MAPSVAKTVAALDQRAGRATSRALRTPRAQVRRTVRGASELFWRVIVALLALSLFGLVLRAASMKPERVDQLTQTLPNAFRKFVNPFEGETK